MAMGWNKGMTLGPLSPEHRAKLAEASRKAWAISETRERIMRGRSSPHIRRSPRHGGAKIKHGLSYSPTYKSWSAMMGRCYDPRYANFAKYGGRPTDRGGPVLVCDRWWRLGVEHFYDDMGERPAGTSLDRIDGRLGYFPGNCRWATHEEQQANRSPRRKKGQ